LPLGELARHCYFMCRTYFDRARTKVLVASVVWLTSYGATLAAENLEFPAWIAGVRAEAAARGISDQILEQALADLEPMPRVVELDRHQPEFTQTFSRYLSKAVTDERVATGRELMRRNAKLLASIERQYGVPARFLVAFWGLETNYGRVKGGFPVIRALATLSFDGRRGAFFRSELFDALTILDQGHITNDAMKGSWAGAMGHTQFMPSSFLAYAVDRDGDRRMDLWNSVPDALASAANYLRHLEWNFGFTWGREVLLPEGFDVDLVAVSASARENNLPLHQWTDLGIRRANGGALPSADINASLVVPEGAEGAAFLVYENYNVILDWNRSVFYAIAVGHLADRLVGAGPLSAPPRTDEPLTRQEVIDLQLRLIELGYLSGEADGILGSKTRRAVKAFQSARGLVADGYADRTLVAEVVGNSTR
jgi:membrane-bound lytic murein transglycosylase B